MYLMMAPPGRNIPIIYTKIYIECYSNQHATKVFQLHVCITHIQVSYVLLTPDLQIFAKKRVSLLIFYITSFIFAKTNSLIRTKFSVGGEIHMPGSGLIFVF
jgi:hypothetical protein